MTEKTFAKIGTTVYQVIKDGHPAELADSYDTALRRIALAFTSESEFASWGRINEFPELATAELSGTFQQRLRFAIEQTGRHCEVAEHRLTSAYEKTSLVRTIGVTTELDPGYELQSELYRAALAVDRDAVADKLAALSLARSLSNEPRSQTPRSYLISSRRVAGWAAKRSELKQPRTHQPS